MFITALAVSVILFGAFLLALWNGVKHDEVGEKAGNMAVGAIVFLFLFVFAALFFVSSGYGHPKSFYRVSTTTWRVLSVATNGQSVYVVASQHDGFFCWRFIRRPSLYTKYCILYTRSVALEKFKHLLVSH